MSLLSRLLDLLLPKRWTRAEVEQLRRTAEDFSDFFTQSEEEPMPLTQKSVEHQQAQIRTATAPRPKVVDHLGNEWDPLSVECSGCGLGPFMCEPCRRKLTEKVVRESIAEVTSPRAITARHCIPPPKPPRKPPRKPR